MRRSQSLVEQNQQANPGSFFSEENFSVITRLIKSTNPKIFLKKLQWRVESILLCITHKDALSVFKTL
jgi:hypothetical protein